METNRACYRHPDGDVNNNFGFTMNPMQLEAIAVKAYNEFYEKHKELFKNDTILYWHQATQYKEAELRKARYQNENKN